MLHSLIVLALTATATAAPADDGRVFVFAFRGDGVEARLVEAIERDVTEAATALELDVISRQDVATMLDVEAARQAASCDAESACISEIAGGLGARRFISGTVAVLGDNAEVSLVLLDTSGAVVLGRATARGPSRDLPALRRAVADATGRLFGVEAAPAPSSGPHTGLLIGGGVATAVGLAGLVGLVPLVGAFGAAGEARDAADVYAQSGARDDLGAFFDASQRRDDAVAAWNTWGLAAVVAGGALVVGGVAAMAMSPVVGGP